MSIEGTIVFLMHTFVGSDVVGLRLEGSVVTCVY